MTLIETWLWCIPEQNNVKVAVRCRPLSRKEMDEGGVNIVNMEGGTVTITNPESGKDDEFCFDHVYSLETQQVLNLHLFRYYQC